MIFNVSIIFNMIIPLSISGLGHPTNNLNHYRFLALFFLTFNIGAGI